MNSTIELAKAALSKGDAAEVKRLMVQLGERLQFLDTQNTYQADDEKIEIEDFMNSTTNLPEEVLGKLYGPEELIPVLEPPTQPAIVKPAIPPPEVITVEAPVVEHPSKWKEKPFPFKYKKWFNTESEHKLNMNKPCSVGISGVRESGKTSLIEAILIQAIQHNQTALIIGGAEDDEVSTAFRAAFKDNVIAVTGEECIFTGAPHITYKEFNTNAPKRAHWYVMSKAFFANETTYSHALLDVLERLGTRKGWKAKGMKPHIVWCAIPEAADVIAAKIILGQSRDERDAARYLEEMNRKLAHMGVSLIIDFQRETSVSAEIRTLTRFRFFTNQGFMKIDPKLFRWVFKFLRLDTFRRLKPGRAVMIFEGGAGCLVKWALPGFHIDRGENVLVDVGIGVDWDKEQLKGIMSSLEKNSRKSKLTEEQVKEIYDRHEGGESLRAIALSMYINASTATDNYNRYARDHPK